MITIEWERLEISSRKLEIPREHFKDGLTKDRNGKDLTEAEDIKKRWQEYTEELYKKGGPLHRLPELPHEMASDFPHRERTKRARWKVQDLV